MSSEEIAAQAVQSAKSPSCWFCDGQRQADGGPYSVGMGKGEGGRKTERTIWVPRCAECENLHRRIGRSVLWLSLILAVLLLGLSILVGVLSSQAIGSWAWLVAILVFVGAYWLSVRLIWMVIRRIAKKAGVQPATYSQSYPEVKALLAQGWQVITLGSAKTPPMPESKPGVWEASKVPITHAPLPPSKAPAGAPGETQASAIAAQVQTLLLELPVVNGEKIPEYRQTMLRAESHPSMFVGNTAQAVEFVTRMVAETEKFILSSQGITRIQKNYLKNSYRIGEKILEIQYQQFWQNGTSSVYSEHVIRIGEDQFEVFGSPTSAARMKAVWK
jgi:hypothetical protein